MFALVLTALPAIANMNNSTGGWIHKRAPEAIGTLKILNFGTQELYNNNNVFWDKLTDDFTLASLASWVRYTDGDVPLDAGFDIPTDGGVIRSTTVDGQELAEIERVQPLNNHFTDSTALKVTVATVVDVISVSGLPDSTQQNLTSGPYQVIVRMPDWWSDIGSYTFRLIYQVPSSALLNVSFRSQINGASIAINDNFIYSSNQPRCLSAIQPEARG